MPKTYNSRQLEHMRIEAEYAPQKFGDIPDLTRHIRPFSHKEVASLVGRITARIAADRPTHLKPDTAYLVAKAMRMWMAEPRREAIVREICGVPGGCINQCLGCIGKGRKVR